MAFPVLLLLGAALNSSFLTRYRTIAVTADKARQIMDGHTEGDDEQAVKQEAKLMKKHVENYDRLRKAFMPHIKVW
jgi:hypothetical protein